MSSNVSLDIIGLEAQEKSQQSYDVQSSNSSQSLAQQLTVSEIREALIKVGLDWLQHLSTALVRKSKEQPEPRERWVAEIQRTLDIYLTRPVVNIALYGQTGAGKSSIINAICDVPKIVHYNPMQAGTQFITIIEDNDRATSKLLWRGEIETISKTEWEDELQILLDELFPLSDGEAPLPVTSHAMKKILAVYPNAKREEYRTWTKETLMSNADLSTILGQTHSYSGKNCKVLQKQMDQFTGSSSRPKFSPLIKIVKIFGPMNLLRGLEIADVPGFGDSNMARCKVAEEYQKKANAFWIILPIVRAVGDGLAKSLFDRTWKQMARLDGKLTEESITFVMTKCDDINVDQVIEGLIMDEDDRVVSLRADERSVDREIRTKIKEQDRIRNQTLKKEKDLSTLHHNSVDLISSGRSSPSSLSCPLLPHPFNEIDIRVEADGANTSLPNAIKSNRRNERTLKRQVTAAAGAGRTSKRQKQDANSEKKKLASLKNAFEDLEKQLKKDILAATIFFQHSYLQMVDRSSRTIISNGHAQKNLSSRA